MKFYKYKGSINFWLKIVDYKLSAIYANLYCIKFFNNGCYNNLKNAAVIYNDGNKCFYLKGRCYGYECNFTKKLWRKFIKLKVFL